MDFSMDFFDLETAALALKHVVYTNDHMHIVYQFYANLKLASLLCDGKFSTCIDGHIIFVTPLLLTQVLGLPNFGNKLFSCDDFHRVLLSRISPIIRSPTNPSSSTGAAAKRSLGQDLVTPLDTWVIHCATMGIPLNFCCLMFGTMVNYGIPDFEGSLSFGPQICYLVAKIGIHPKFKYSESTFVEHLRAQHVFCRVGWSKCLPLPANGLEGDVRYNCSGMDADVVNNAESDAQAKLTVWCDHSDALDDYLEGKPSSVDVHRSSKPGGATLNSGSCLSFQLLILLIGEGTLKQT
ncbi:hypothetical protein LINPERHAP2_LOCUS16971 [Linum perenne]